MKSKGEEECIQEVINEEVFAWEETGTKGGEMGNIGKSIKG